MKHNLVNLEVNLESWARLSGLTSQATLKSQTKKMLEEYLELVAAQNPNASPAEIIQIVTKWMSELREDNRIKSVSPEDSEAAIEDALGDIHVVGTVIFTIIKKSRVRALKKVYEIIQKRLRGGKMIAGNFVKREDQ